MSDEDIDISDIPPLSEEFFAKAQLRMPKSAITMAFEVDPEHFLAFRHKEKVPNSKCL
ncbi:hypothetical protein QUA12_11395 [Microcoleus sp. Pol8_D1]